MIISSMGRQYRSYEEFIETIFNMLYKYIDTVDCPISLSVHHDAAKFKKFGEVDILGNVHIGLARILSEYSTDAVIQNSILETVIHELVHLDQSIDYKLLVRKEYADSIEQICINSTCKFILQNTVPLERELGVLIDTPMFEHKIKGKTMYSHKSLTEAYKMKLEYVYNSVEIFRVLRNYGFVNISYIDNNKAHTFQVKTLNSYNKNLYEFNKILNWYVNKNPAFSHRKYDLCYKDGSMIIKML